MKMNLLGYTCKIYNSGYNTEMINKQCNAGDPLETPGGLYRGPPSMLINVNTIKRSACEILNQVECSINVLRWFGELSVQLSSVHSYPSVVCTYIPYSDYIWQCCY